MARGIARLYPGTNPEETSVIDFGMSLVGAEKSQQLQYTLEKLGYVAGAIDKPQASISVTHLETRPPLRDDHLAAIGATIREVACELHDDGGTFYDNRVEPATLPYDGSSVITEWL